MATDTVKSTSLLYLDSTPIIEPNAGSGMGARVVMIDDYCTATAAGLQSSTSYYKLVRVPTFALIKSVQLGVDASPVIGASSVLAVDVGWIFSDSTDDGTPVPLQGLIPTSANTGGTTTIASYSSPNKMYGTWKPTNNAGVIEPSANELLLNGLGTNYFFTAGFTNLPLFQLFGFTDGRGYPADPGGYFDLFAFVATAAATGGACNIYARVRYAI